MREIRPYGSEGGVALTTPLLPLSIRAPPKIATAARVLFSADHKSHTFPSTYCLRSQASLVPRSPRLLRPTRPFCQLSSLT